MAGKGGSKKDAKEAPKSKSGALVTSIHAACAVLTILAALVLAVGAFNLGPTGMVDFIHSLAFVPIALGGLCGLATVFLAPSVRAVHTRQLEAKLEELEQRLSGRVGEAMAKVDTHIGEDYQAVREHNRQLQEKLEQFQKAERDKMAEEMEKLRTLNGELEEQIKRWAIGSVDQMVSETGSEGIKVA